MKWVLVEGGHGAIFEKQADIHLMLFFSRWRNLWVSLDGPPSNFARSLFIVSGNGYAKSISFRREVSNRSLRLVNSIQTQCGLPVDAGRKRRNADWRLHDTRSPSAAE